jgi:hypothetical protein
MQLQALEDVPCIPVRDFRALSAHKRGTTGCAPGTTHFYGVRWENAHGFNDASVSVDAVRVPSELN